MLKITVEEFMQYLLKHNPKAVICLKIPDGLSETPTAKAVYSPMAGLWKGTYIPKDDHTGKAEYGEQENGYAAIFLSPRNLT